MVMIENGRLSEDEAALYDRQIRLWGLDAQKRLRAANVLIVGASGLGAEVIKNLVLAGVNSLTILDHRDMTERDACSNFLAPVDRVGQNIAVASVERAQNLNPMVKVTAETMDANTINDSFLSNYNVVCVCHGTKDQIITLNNKCRDIGSFFFAGEVYGMHGFSFTDLNEHSYVEEVKERVSSGEGDAKATTEETKMVKRTESFVPFSSAIDLDWTSPKYASRIKRASPSIFILNVLLEFACVHGRRPDPAHRQVDEIELLTVKNSLLEKMGVPQEKVSNNFVQMIFGELSPACAVVGGVLSQEIIKAVSKKDSPLKNFFYFSPDEGAGVVEALGF